MGGGGGKGVLNPLNDPALSATNKVTSAVSPALGAAERGINDLDKTPKAPEVPAPKIAAAIEAEKALPSSGGLDLSTEKDTAAKRLLGG
jgi:hypothetical protein